MKYVVKIALRWTCLPPDFWTDHFDECIVESEVSSFKDDENAEKLNFISSNGPQPLCSMSVVEAMLINHFGTKWHFNVMKSSFFVWKTVDYCSKGLPNSLHLDKSFDRFCELLILNHSVFCSQIKISIFIFHLFRNLDALIERPF